MYRILFALVGCAPSTVPAPTSNREPSPAVPTCAALREHLHDVMWREARSRFDTPEARRTFDAMFDQRFAACEHEWSSDVKRCLARSTSVEGNNACQRSARIAEGADLGGPACGPLIDHMISFAGGPEADSADLRQRLARACATLTRATKECIAAGRSLEDFNSCIGIATPPP